jgi:hypothetical protein
MPEIAMFTTSRPAVAPLTHEERERIWSLATDRPVVSEGAESGAPFGPADVLADDVLADVDVVARPPASRRVVRAAVAAAVAVAAGIGGFAVLGRDDITVGTGSAPPTVPPPPTDGEVVMLVPPELPDGVELNLPGQTSMRDRPSGFQLRLYGAADDPGDPSRMVSVEYAASSFMGLPCQSMPNSPTGTTPADAEIWMDGATPMTDAEPFEVAGGTGYTCTVYGPLAAGWATEGVSVQLVAGTAVTRAELVAFARSLETVPTATPVENGPPVDLVADPLPDGWVVLVHEDVPWVQHVTERTWLASVDGHDSTPYVVVHTWTGVDAQGVFAKVVPVQAERITIRGHDGYRYVSEQRGTDGPAQIDIGWMEQPGLVVHVSANDLFEVDELTEFIEGMVVVDAAGFEAFDGS